MHLETVWPSVEASIRTCDHFSGAFPLFLLSVECLLGLVETVAFSVGIRLGRTALGHLGRLAESAWLGVDLTD